MLGGLPEVTLMRRRILKERGGRVTNAAAWPSRRHFALQSSPGALKDHLVKAAAPLAGGARMSTHVCMLLVGKARVLSL